MSQAWKERVKTREDAESFFAYFYPHYPDVLVKAIALSYYRALLGGNEEDRKFKEKLLEKSEKMEKNEA